MTQLTPHFSLEDLTHSDTAEHLGIDNTPPPELIPSAQGLAEMLERVRARLSEIAGHDVPMYPSSGYRCPPLNWIVRNPRTPWEGQEDATGDHPLFDACDFRAPAFGTPLEVCRALAPHVDELGIGQLIQEGTWVHASTRMVANPVNRVITKVGDGYVAGVTTSA